MDLRPAVARQLDMIAFHNYGNVDEQLTQVPRHQFGFWGKRQQPDRPCLQLGLPRPWRLLMGHALQRDRERELPVLRLAPLALELRPIRRPNAA